MDIKIPEERIGVLVGPGGSMKSLIEEKTKTELEIDSETGTVSIASAEDPLLGHEGHGPGARDWQGLLAREGPVCFR